MRPRFCLISISLLASLLFGCGDGTHQVTGKIMLDGKPLPEGRIAFVPAAGGIGGAAEIKEGVYSLKAPSGDYSVQISAEKTGALPPGQAGMFGATEGTYQYLPVKYNAQTELKATLPATGALDFDLKSE